MVFSEKLYYSHILSTNNGLNYKISKMKNTKSENSIRYSERLKVKIAGGLVEGTDEINEIV